MATTSLGLVGDVMFGRLVDEHQRARAPVAVWGDRLDRLQSLDGLFLNLECCLSTRGTPYTATYHPFHFRADPAWAIPALEAVAVDGVALANNHVFDYGSTAFDDTLTSLDDAEIDRVGAGRDLTEAFTPAILSVDPLTIAVIAFTDNVPDWAASVHTPGVAHIEIDHEDPAVRRTVSTAIDRATAGDPDLLVASLHWGPNMTDGPDRARRAFARWLVDAGVDVVFGHSAHVFHGIEVRNGAVLCYDGGDFVDDYAIDPDLRNDRGFLFVLELDEEGNIERLRLEPTAIRDFAVHSVDPIEATWWHETLRRRTERYGLDTSYEVDGAAVIVKP